MRQHLTILLTALLLAPLAALHAADAAPHAKPKVLFMCLSILAENFSLPLDYLPMM
jgi:hypothetical protein